MTSLDEFLSTHTPPVQEMALKTRELVLSLFPDAVKQIDVPGKLLGYGTAPTYAGTVCVIMPLKDSLNLGFARGTSLPDPAHKLQGTGKKARHIKFKSLDEIDDPAVRALLQAAIDLAR